MKVNPTVIKVIGKVGAFAGPVLSGLMKVASDIEEKKQKELIKSLVERVTELERLHK